jgi:hypothetical protein
MWLFSCDEPPEDGGDIPDEWEDCCDGDEYVCEGDDDNG